MYEVNVITNIEECERLWKSFSPNVLFFDLWDVRMCYYKEYPYPLEFYVAQKDGIPSGLLALQFNTVKQRLETFGGGYFCYNRYLGDEPALQDIIETIDKPLYLYDYFPLGNLDTSFVRKDAGYRLEIEGMHDAWDHIQRNFAGKSKNRIKYELHRFTDLNLAWFEGETDDLNLLFEFNMKKFSAESFFNDPRDRRAFLNIAELPYMKKLCLMSLDSKIVGITFGILYNDTYTYLTSGIDQNEYGNVSLYLNYLTLETAIHLEALHFDALSGDNGWKKNFHLTEIPLYDFVSNYSPPE